AVVDAANRYVVRSAPWEQSGERAAAVVRVLRDALVVLAAELAPFLPAASAALRARLGDATGGPIRRGPPLFPPLAAASRLPQPGRAPAAMNYGERGAR